MKLEAHVHLKELAGPHIVRVYGSSPGHDS